MGEIVASSAEAVRLARRLRSLRESHESGLSQSALARALSDDTRVAVATISSWENLTNPKVPPADRLRSYALFFCTQKSTEGAPHLLDERELTSDERDRFHDLLDELTDMRNAVRNQSHVSSPTTAMVSSSYTWDFEHGPITIICPEAPSDLSPALADPHDPNYTRMYRYADVDALIELWGHLRASNPELQVTHRLASEVTADDLSSHLVLLGGAGWNPVAARLLKTLQELPIAQVQVDDLDTGEIFRARGLQDDPRPEFVNGVLVEDVGLLARLANPFNHNRTITICNGIHSRGVLGAVRSLTDIAVREKNEGYLSRRFPGGRFAVLMRVPVLNGDAISPDFEIDDTRLYEWSPEDEGRER